MIEMFMLKDLWEVPWTVLRHFGYDDELNLDIPDWVVSPTSKVKGKDESQWFLSASAVEFLDSLFTQFDSNNDGELTEDDTKVRLLHCSRPKKVGAYYKKLSHFSHESFIIMDSEYFRSSPIHLYPLGILYEQKICLRVVFRFRVLIGIISYF